MPESAEGNRGDTHPGLFYLAMRLIQTIDGETGQFFRIDLSPAVRSGFDLIRKVRAIAFYLASLGIEDQGANGGCAGIQTYNEDIRNA